MLDIINSVLNTVFSIFFVPFESASPVWAMLVISAVTGVAMLFIFKATSDQNGIKTAKNRVKGHFLAIRLYRDDISLMFDTMKNIMLSNLFYMKKSLRPMLFLILPVAVVLVQLGSRYEFRPFNVGETMVVTLQLSDFGSDVDLSEVSVELPTGLVTDMPPVRVEEFSEVNWRLRAEAPGVYELNFKYQGQAVSKEVHVVDELAPIASQISQDSFTVTMMNPAEPSLPQTSFASAISVAYPKRDFQLFGLGMHWLVAFFVISLVAAFALKGVFGVEV